MNKVLTLLILVACFNRVGLLQHDCIWVIKGLIEYRLFIQIETKTTPFLVDNPGCLFVLLMIHIFIYFIFNFKLGCLGVGLVID
jgi:hypothetical protein